jgi:tryptophanyl-tRNA synthetase
MIVEKTVPPSRSRIMSGHRPTGRLHLGHSLGTLENWVRSSETMETYFEVADLHAFTTAVPGTDGRKMSKSYHNTIDLADDEETTPKKVRSYVTDPLKVRRNDPGRPQICPVFPLHRYSNAARVEAIVRAE